PAFKTADARTRVGYADCVAGRQHVSIELTFADVDSHVTLDLGLLVGRFLALHAGRAPYHLLRTRAEGRTDQALPRCQTPRSDRGPVPSASGSAAAAPTHLSVSTESASTTCKVVEFATIGREGMAGFPVV